MMEAKFICNGCGEETPCTLLIKAYDDISALPSLCPIDSTTKNVNWQQVEAE